VVWRIEENRIGNRLLIIVNALTIWLPCPQFFRLARGIRHCVVKNAAGFGPPYGYSTVTFDAEPARFDRGGLCAAGGKLGIVCFRVTARYPGGRKEPAKLPRTAPDLLLFSTVGCMLGVAGGQSNVGEAGHGPIQRKYLAGP
jgi:hypothetical protein